MLLHEKEIEKLVTAVTERVRAEVGAPAGVASTGAASGEPDPAAGVFPTPEEALSAGAVAAREVGELSLEQRGRVIAAMREAAIANAGLVSRLAVEETGMGRVADKISKNRLAAEKTPGLEDIGAEAESGDHGLTLTERAPWGLIGSIIPSTNPTETIINNGIGMFAGGNAVVFNPHPNAKRTSNTMIALLNRASAAAGGPDVVFASVVAPTIETAQAVMNDNRLSLLAVTGAEGVVKAALSTGKIVVAAGPGNPPAVVDAEYDVAKAGADIVAGASLDNNIICTDEKVTVVVESAARDLVAAMEGAGAYIASGNQVRQLQELLIPNPNHLADSPVNRAFVGRDAGVILEAIGVRNAGDRRLIVCQVPPEHPISWTEMLMPVMPVISMRTCDEAIDYGVAVEAGRRHTASMHSHNITHLSRMAKEINCSLFVKNAPNYAGLGLGGEGYTSFTIASPTGHGMTSARTWTRLRRCVLVDSFRIV